jgi:hypothetical protein
MEAQVHRVVELAQNQFESNALGLFEQDVGPPALNAPCATDVPSSQAIYLVSDLNACADNTIAAQNWQNWWHAVSIEPINQTDQN